METIIIFTNWQSIYEHQNETNISWIPDEQEIKIIHIDDKRTFVIAHDKILGVNDGNIGFEKLIERIQKHSIVYILHHTYPENNHLEMFINTLVMKGCVCKNKVPLNPAKAHYHPEYRKIQEIDTCVKNNYSFENPYIEGLIKVFDELKSMLSGNSKLESALDFLHDCLVKNPKNFDTSKLSGYSIEENKKVREYIELMPKTIPEITNSKEYSLYIESFNSLRNELLKIAGV
ncbi:hypothetical protein [Flavobacterium sp. UBA6031]|uniref:hypothetical protein n=1 Tax=Flavobacterium sp. UBA6031 TaxID=1946551 RepID=UPI0025C1786A|nr:hypothetical protein [Flavobacterium sp. UBA6031]